MANQYIEYDFLEWVSVPGPEWGVGNDFHDFSNYLFIESDWVYDSYDFYSRSLNHIFADQTYVYVAHDCGLDIIDINTHNRVAYLVYDNGFTNVWSNSNTIFLGTAADGVKYLDMISVTGTVSSELDLCLSLTDFASYPELTSNHVNYIHGCADSSVCFCTSSGVDFFRLEPNGYRSYTVVSGSTMCFVCSDRQLYYVVSGTNYNIYKVDPITDWDTSNFIYSTGDGVLSGTSVLNDLFVTCGTTTVESNTLFVATDVGAYVIDEYNDSCFIFRDQS